LLPPLLAILIASLACATSSTPPPDTSSRATSLAQTAAALLTSTAQASITPVTATLPPTNTALPPTATATVPPTVAPITPESSATPTSAAPPCTGEDDSDFVADVNVPDGTHFAAGTAFNKTWRLRNSGDCTWTTAYQIRHVGDHDMSGADTNLPNDVPPGASVDITVSLIAPAGTGTFISRWQLFTPGGVAFGTKPYVEIIVP
jgi:hypothetical protein